MNEVARIGEGGVGRICLRQQVGSKTTDRLDRVAIQICHQNCAAISGTCQFEHQRLKRFRGYAAQHRAKRRRWSAVHIIVYSEEFRSEYTSTEVYYDDQPEAHAYEDQGYDDAATAEPDAEAYDEASQDQTYEDPAADEPVPETYQDASQDETYADPEADQAYEEPTDDQSYEEPVQDQTYEEPLAEEPAYDEPAYEEPAAEESAYEEPAYEEPAYDEPAYEEPVYEEPAAEEPAYEEPAYEEPAYEEPAQESGDGSECYYDDDGNLIC